MCAVGGSIEVRVVDMRDFCSRDIMYLFQGKLLRGANYTAEKTQMC